MLGGASQVKAVAFVGLELTALLGVATLVRVLSCLVLAWLFVLAFKHRRAGLAAG